MVQKYTILYRSNLEVCVCVCVRVYVYGEIDLRNS